ncbi:Fe(2+)-trafficking protein [Candidatus Palauibacter sp.]|uniref:Fe(2+)-trafficking protein n=1 Tax=Candidatus Palauibacter sp. TaxID=3101350 RepID=UPI003B019C6F
MTDPFVCTRCDRDDQERIGRNPFPGELGTRIVAEICSSCWEEWKERQMLLINHYGLKLHEAAAREFLYKNLRIFLFREEGSAARIDTGEEGSVTW